MLPKISKIIFNRTNYKRHFCMLRHAMYGKLSTMVDKVEKCMHIKSYCLHISSFALVYLC